MDKRITPQPKPQRARHFIREWRLYRGLTQPQLAERIGKTHGAISQLETNKTAYTQDTLEALAFALRCEPGDLLSRDPNKEGAIVDLMRILRTKDPSVVLNVVRALPDATGTDN